MYDIFSYDDYRAYLRDYYAYMKQHEPGFTYRSFAEKGGLDSPNYLQLVVSGKRNLTTTLIFQFARALGLDQREMDFFERLVQYTQAGDAEARRFYEQRLNDVKAVRLGASVNLEQRKLDFEWHVPVAEVLLDGRTREEAVPILVANFGFSVAQSEALIDELIRRKSFVVTGDRLHVVEEHSYFRDRQGNRPSFKQYISEHLKYVRERIDELYPTGKFICHTFTAKCDSRAAMEAAIADCLLKFQALSVERHGPGTATFQFNVQLFPLTAPERSGS